MTEASTILQWLNAHPHLAGIATFIISAAESVAIIGTIVPGSIMMTAIGTLAGAKVIPLWSTIFWAILGAIVGDGISYWMGYYFKNRLHNIWPFRTHPDLLKNGEIFFHKYGGMSVFIGRFVGPVRALVPLVAGMLGMKPSRFAIANIASAMGWAPAYMLPGILLGAASLELPPDIAVQAILMLLLISMLIIFCLWSIQKLFLLINHQIDQFLNWIWFRLYRSRYFHLFTTILKHQDPKKTHGQLALAFYLIVTSLVFILLTMHVLMTSAQTMPTNKVLFHLFRSFRMTHDDTTALILSMLGEKIILIPVFLVLCAWLFIRKYWRAATHILVLTVLTAGSVWVIKNFTHSIRPWGIAQFTTEKYSFPSGHTTLSVVFYFGFVLLLINALQPKIKRYWPLFFCATLIVLGISISRLYLGAHWFTDVLGGWLLGAILLILVTLSYNRKAEKKLKPFSITLVTFIALCLSFSGFYYQQFKEFKQQYMPLNWPTYSVTLDSWWNQQDKNLPKFRINRFGLHGGVLNLQWIGDLTQIKEFLLKNGWQNPPARDWISILHRITGIESTQELPIVAPLHLDKQPLLVLIKQLGDGKTLIALRLWDSNFYIQGVGELWVGSIDVVPKTYGWLLKRVDNQVPIALPVIFATEQNRYETKFIQLNFIRHKQIITRNVLLIKPR